MNKRQKVIDFLSKRYNNILKSKQDGTISWVAIKDEFHQETGFDLHKDYFRSVFKNIKIGTATIGYMHVGDTYNSSISTECITGSSVVDFKYLIGNENKDKGTKEFTFTADNIPTEEEIISHFNIDTTKYRINQIYHKTSFGGKYAITVSLLANKGNQTIDIDYNFIHKISNIQPIEKINLTVNKLKGSLPVASVIIPKQDAHWNKSDIDGNNSIEDRFVSFTKILLNQLEKTAKVNQIEEILYIVGSDEFNSEWTSATTKGTPQQDSISYTKSFEKISEFNIEIIKLLRFYSPKVKVMLLNGNHDHNVSWHLAHLLKHVFSKNETIEINDSLENTKFYSYRGTLTLLNHGDAIKPKDLAAKFPILAKEQWSNHTNFMVLTGDKHHEVAHDFNGVTWYQVPQLSPARSKWDDKCGHGTSKPELLTFILEEGHLSNIFRTPIK